MVSEAKTTAKQRGVVPGPDAAPRWDLLWAALILAAALAAYHNSFDGPFVFDDPWATVSNPTIRKLWPVWRVLLPPVDRSPTDRRPVANLSLAINYALGGTRVRGYHIFNFTAHVLAAWVLFGVIRRSLRLPGFAKWHAAATPLALIAALIWTVHPLLTNAVTYVIQRTEVLAGLFYLLALYCVIRGAEQGSGFGVQGSGDRNPKSAPYPLSAVPYSLSPVPFLWYTAAVACCLLAVGSKESAVSAPVVVAVYDRLFLARSWREVWNRRWGLYVGLAACWGLTAAMLLGDWVSPAPPPGIVVHGQKYGPWLEYALLQFEAVGLYLRLCFWPSPLILDYGWRYVGRWGEVLPYAAIVLALALGTAAALRWRPGLGFLGLWFFAILAPSSGVVPITMEWAAEKRMYLPLAAVATLVVAGAYAWGQHAFALGRRPEGALRRRLAGGLGYALAAAALAALVLVSVRRNEDYRSELAIWRDDVQKCPRNPRAHYNLAVALDHQGRLPEAIDQFQQAFRLKPDSGEYCGNLGDALGRAGRTAEAIDHYRRAIELKPGYFEAHNNLGLALARAGRIAEAIVQYQQALALNPGLAEAHNNLGLALARAGRIAEAIVEYQRAIELKPDFAEARNNLGAALRLAGRLPEAIAQYRQALELKPDFCEAHNNLGLALARAGRTAEAIGHYRRAVELKPGFAEAHHNLALALAGAGKIAEAIGHYQRAVELKPDYCEAHNHLGTALYLAGRTAEAMGHYQRALELEPDSSEAHHNLGLALAGAGRVREAAAQFERVIALDPGDAEAQASLAWLLAASAPAEGGDPARAVSLAEQGRRRAGHDSADGLDVLAMAYAAAGRFPEAVATARKAAGLAAAAGNAPLAEQIRQRLALYAQHRPYRLPVGADPGPDSGGSDPGDANRRRHPGENRAVPRRIE
jgi:tetratricopeptide (TPR) repeat protein